MFPHLQTILVATDFSPTSDHALSYARAMARSFGASLYLVHVVPDPVLASAWSEAYAYDLTALAERLRFDAHQRLAEMAETIDDVAVRTEALVGNPAAAITATAAEHGVDLIVMGTHGRTGVTHFFMGSVAERVVRTAPCPVLTVREAARDATVSELSDTRAIRV